MFGEDGWCRSCGTPLRRQCGPLTLKRQGLLSLAGAFVPNWRFDAICLEASLASHALDKFSLDLREVAWKGTPPGKAMQIIVPSVGSSWYDSEKLFAATSAKHGSSGSRCPGCGIWRWLPLSYDELPPVTGSTELQGADICASPEWFGVGWKSFRQILVRRELAQLIVCRSPKDFRIQEAH